MNITLTASKLTLILTPFQPAWSCARSRRVESESETTIAVTAMMTANSAVHSWAARALFGLRKFAAAGEHDRLANAEVLATFGPTIGLGAVRNPLVGLSVPMLARYSRRESERGPSGSMVCRPRVTSALNRPSIALIAEKAKDGRIVTFLRWGPPSPHSGGPGEPKNGSWRSRWPSLRPDGAWTVPRSAGTDSPGQERG